MQIKGLNEISPVDGRGFAYFKCNHYSALQILLRGISCPMIHSFACEDTQALFQSRAVPRFKNIERVARRKLLQLHAASLLNTLRVPPVNMLETLKGDRTGQHSIRVNEQWRICFVWQTDGAYQVEIVDYH